MTAILTPIQNSIEALHDVSTHMDVRAFLVDEDTWKRMPGAKQGLPEQLFVLQLGDDDVELGLYIAPSVMETLKRDDPRQRLHLGNLESYCIALEGVSHFVYLIWRGREGHSVSALELELQAEVDKFMLALTWLVEQGAPVLSTSRLLLKRLFTEYSLRDGVPPEEADRYHVASRAALRFCRQLVERHAPASDLQSLQREARKFYRRGLRDKLRAA